MEEIIYEFLFGTGKYQQAIVPALAFAIPGLIQAAGGIFGAGRRKREYRAAQQEINQAQSAFANQSFQNTYRNQENVFEDATVNTMATDYQMQQNDKVAANTLNTLSQVGLGGASAQAVAASLMGANQGVANNLATQEQNIQQVSLANQARLNQQEAAGADVMQTRNFQKLQQLYNLSAGRLNQANKARSRATSQIFGGLGSAVGGVVSAKLGGTEGGIDFLSGRSPVARKASPNYRLENERNIKALKEELIEFEYQDNLRRLAPSRESKTRTSWRDLYV